jgi:hypothetical protein
MINGLHGTEAQETIRKFFPASGIDVNLKAFDMGLMRQKHSGRKQEHYRMAEG